MWKQRVAAVVLAGSVLLVPVSSTAAPAWAVDPADPGSNRPSTGQSLFDEITADGVPFPFEALVRKIEEKAGCLPGRCVTSVLIPLGRSLQRTAAAPDFFSFPRVVAAVTTDGGGHLFAKDRIYLGYQERADVIEVISYNEAAARFEFQLVRNYGAHSAPETIYASRAVCTACHQNHAPVFSRQQWDETNANPGIAARLASDNGRTREQLYGVAIRRGVDLPNAIDDSTDRANRFAVVHRIWRDVCDSACRSHALQAALQYRLSQEQGFEARPALGQRFAAQWPSGLAVPNPDLPNRDPLVLAGEQSANQIDVGAAFEALVPRVPIEIWTGNDALLVPRFVAGLASLFAEADVRDLDAELKRGAPAAARRTYTARCSVDDGRYLCDGEVSLRGSHSMIDRLSLGGKELTRLQLRNGAVTRNGATARTVGGDAIERIDLPSRGRPGVATVTVVEDFAPARAALARHDWSGAPFTRARVRATLGLPPLNACCGPSASVPAANDAVVAAVVPREATAFIAPCAACHRTAERSPPNFLAGDAQQISASLAECAPRMFVRLAMWQSPASSRARVPMPPPRASHGGSPSIQAEPDPAVSALQATVAEWLRAESGQAPNLAAMLARGYENLRPCLPAGR